ncbi:MAG TPA: hypothetical protein VGD22_09960 [Sphingobacteriaceae bacterium]
MNSKTVIAGIIGGIASFLAGWVIFGILLMDFYSKNMVHYDGLMKEPMEMWAIAIGSLLHGILLAYLLNLAGVRSAGRGAVVGGITFFLMSLGVDMMMYAQMNLINFPMIAIDVLGTALLGATAGAAVGWWLGREQKIVAVA